MANKLSSITAPISLQRIRKLNFFWYGFIIYSLSVTFTGTGHVNFTICQGAQIIGLVLMTSSFLSIAELKIDNAYLRFIYIPYCLWLAYLVIQAFSARLDYTFLKGFLFNPYEGMLYFAPLLLLLPRNIIYYKRLFYFIPVLGFFYILFDVIFIKDILSSDHSSIKSQGIVEAFSDLSFASGFIVLTYAYHNKKRQLLCLSVVLIQLFFAVVRARRGLVLMYSDILFVSYLLYIFHSRMKLMIIYLTIFFCLVATLYASNLYRPTDNKTFGYLLDRGAEDTRSTVELYFHNDMKTKDWIFGRGIKGEYFCPDVEEDQVTNYRYTIETGYEQTILKGGLISLGLFLLIAVPAIIKGLFNSNNILSKVAAIWIFMSLINSYPSTVNAFTMQYLMVWISIGVCYSKKLRNLPEEQLKKLFNTFR